MTRRELTRVPFTSGSQILGPKAEPTLQPPGFHQSNKYRAQSLSSKPFQPQYFYISKNEGWLGFTSAWGGGVM